MKLTNEYSKIQTQINNLLDKNMPVPQKLYHRQFEIVTEINDSFEKNTVDCVESYSLGLRYNVMLQYFAKKIGKPVEMYINKIKEYAFKITGEELTQEELNKLNNLK